MQLAARPYLTAGVALAGAGIIAAPPVAQHLPEIQASEVRLANAEESITDLFSGATNGAANLASAASAADLPGSLFSPLAAAAGSDPYFVNPLQTWVDVFTNAVANLQTIGAATIPGEVAQQVAANWIEYASLDIGGYQTAANNAVSFFGAPSFAHGIPLNFWPVMGEAFSFFQSGDIQDGIETVGGNLIQAPIVDILEPMEKALYIPVYLTQNIANATNFLLDPSVTLGNGEPLSAIVTVGSSVVLGLIPAFYDGLGVALQPAYDAFAAGDLVGGVLNVLNTPGVVADSMINGTTGSSGFLSPLNLPLASGTLAALVNYVPQQMATSLVAPGATNIAGGGSLATAWGALVNQVVNGWPTANQIVDNLVAVVNYLFPSTVGGAAATAGVLPVDIAGIAPSIAAEFSGVAPSIAADLAGIAPSIATNLAGTLAPELGTLAANILTSLF